VHFRYPTRQQEAANGLSFVIEPDEAVSIVGPTCCHKSTALLLIQRFYDIGDEQILHDDTAIRWIDPISLRRHISAPAGAGYVLDVSQR
jgi:ABC-type multidrug transport system fused ATPase/permease subunit